MKEENKFEQVFQIAVRSCANILITGPTGSGKTYLARKIHLGSARRLKPFVTVNLACLHEGTLESELFGHERGAFTGADQRRVGRLEQAQGGTVFLDEIGELSPRLQARLLEFLQSRTITPVGSNREIPLDVRVIAATHRDLDRAILKAEFREDLFHRLRVVSLHLRSIAERAEEFDSIMHACLEDIYRVEKKNVLKISEEVAARLEAYSWPGNIRELRNVLEYAVLASEGPEIQLNDLPVWFGKSVGNSAPVPESIELPTLMASEANASLDFEAAMCQFERAYLERALRRFKGRISYTARKIGINKTTLLRRIKTYGIEVFPSEKTKNTEIIPPLN